MANAFDPSNWGNGIGAVVPVINDSHNLLDSVFEPCELTNNKPALSDLYDAVRRAEHRCKVNLSKVRALIQKSEDARLMGQDWHQFEMPILDDIRKAMKPEMQLTGFALERKARQIFIDEPKQVERLDEVFA